MVRGPSPPGRLGGSSAVGLGSRGRPVMMKPDAPIWPSSCWLGGLGAASVEGPRCWEHWFTRASQD